MNGDEDALVSANETVILHDIGDFEDSESRVAAATKLPEELGSDLVDLAVALQRPGDNAPPRLTPAAALAVGGNAVGRGVAKNPANQVNKITSFLTLSETSLVEVPGA